MKKVWFIGAGPGDPQLLTLHGVAALRQAQLVFAPDPYEHTCADFLGGKEVCCPFDFDFGSVGVCP